MLPAAILRRVLDDPRKIPYLLVWNQASSATAQDAVRIARYSEPDTPDYKFDWTGWLEVKRTTGARRLLHMIERPMPRNRGKSNFVICPECYKPRHALYGWELNRTKTHAALVADWQCRICAGLRYASEGGALQTRFRGRLGRQFGVGRLDRPAPWYPEVFLSVADAAAAGVCKIIDAR
jgi:hypothetical protein